MDFFAIIISMLGEMMDNFDRTVRLIRKGDKGKKSIPKLCTWCNAIFCIEEWDVEHDKRTGVSHGMCPECFERQSSELEKE